MRSRRPLPPAATVALVIALLATALAPTSALSPTPSLSRTRNGTSPSASVSGVTPSSTASDTGGTTSQNATVSTSLPETETASVEPTVSPSHGITDTGDRGLTETTSQSRQPTPTVTVAASDSVSPTFEGKAWLCRSVELSATLQLLSPSLGPPVRAGSGRLRTTEAAIREQGLIVAFNISSCHELFLDRAPMVPTVLRNESSEEDPNSVLNLLFAGDPVNIVAENGAGVGTFARLVEQNPQLLRFIGESPTSGHFKIGPDPLYGTSELEEITVQLSGSEYFLPPLVDGRSLTFTLLIEPDAAPKPIPERAAAQGVAFAASALAVLVGTPQTPTIVGRIGSVYLAADCPTYPSADEQVRPDQNLLGQTFGAERRLVWVAGGAVYNPMLLLLIAFAGGTLVALVAFVTGKGVPDVMSAVRFPGVVVPLYMFLLQGTLYSSGVVITESREFVSSFFAFAAIVCIAGVAAAIAFITVPRDFDALALRCGAETAGTPLHPAVKILFGAGVWVDRTHDKFVGPMGGMFKEFSPQRRWFLCVEVVVSTVLGIIASTLPATRIQCIVANTLQTLVLWLHLVIVIGTHPYVSLPAFIITIFTSLCLLVAAIITAVMPVVGTSDSSRAATDGMLLAAACLSLLKGMLDVAAALFRVVLRHDVSSRVRRWQRDEFRQIRQRALLAQRRRRLERALDDKYGDHELSSTASSSDDALESAATVLTSKTDKPDAFGNVFWGVPPVILKRLSHFNDRDAVTISRHVGDDAEDSRGADGGSADGDADAESVTMSELARRAEQEREAEAARRAEQEELDAMLVERTGMTKAEILARL